MFENNAVTINCEENNKFLDVESESIIRRFLTKQMIRILCLLWNCSLSNKEIADKMNLSSSALSNILQRMKKCEVALLMIEKKKNILFILLLLMQRNMLREYCTLEMLVQLGYSRLENGISINR